MEIRQLLIFCTAAELLNFTKTGQHLGYTQSNITGQINLLERELKVQLFERIGRNVQLTNEGSAFYQNARHILDLCEQAKSDFSPDNINGILKVGVAETIGVYHLPSILKEYRDLYPKVEIRVRTDTCESFLELLKNNTIDIALVLTDRVTSPEMVVYPLCTEPMAAVISPAHPLAKKKGLEPKDLANDCLITTLPGCGYRPLVLSMFEKQGCSPGSLLELSNVTSIKNCAISELGIAILPAIAVQEDLDRGTLMQLNLKEELPTIKIHLVYHQKKWLTPSMRVFLELCDGIFC